MEHDISHLEHYKPVEITALEIRSCLKQDTEDRPDSKVEEMDRKESNLEQCVSIFDSGLVRLSECQVEQEQTRRQIRALEAEIGRVKAAEILSMMAECLTTGLSGVYHYLDASHRNAIGTWEITAALSNGSEEVSTGPVISGKHKILSDYIRERVPFDNLILLDG